MALIVLRKKIAAVTAFKQGFLSVINVNFAFFSFQDLLYTNQKVIIRISYDQNRAIRRDIDNIGN